MNADTATTERNPLGSFSIWLESLSEEASADFCKMKVERSYRNGEYLFTQNSAPEGIFLVRSGRIKLTAASPKGKKMLLQIAQPGEVLGLGAIAEKPYELTAQCLGACKVDFVSRWRFLEFLKHHPEAGIPVALALGEDLDCAYQRLRALRSRRTLSRGTARQNQQQ